MILITREENLQGPGSTVELAGESGVCVESKPPSFSACGVLLSPYTND